jgi:hypothetical protein
MPILLDGGSAAEEALFVGSEGDVIQARKKEAPLLFEHAGLFELVAAVYQAVGPSVANDAYRQST